MIYCLNIGVGVFLIHAKLIKRDLNWRPDTHTHTEVYRDRSMQRLTL